jgi:hypothetical protein
LAGPRSAASRTGQAGPAPGPQPTVIEKGDFRFACDERGVSALADPNDPFKATLMPTAGARGAGAPVLGLAVSYRTDKTAGWTDLPSRGPEWQASPGDGTVVYTSGGSGPPVKAVETFRTDGRSLDWTIDLESTGATPVEVGDLAVSIPTAGPYGEDPAQIFERGFLRHQFVSGAGSFVYFVRASGAPPYLLLTVLPGTKLEYWTGAGRGGGQLFVHSGKSGPAETRGTWRQPHTTLALAAAGRPGSRVSYGFRFQWAKSYDELRALLYDAGLFDVRVVPGMTVPEDLAARFSLHTKARIEKILAEFPGQTAIRSLGEHVA